LIAYNETLDVFKYHIENHLIVEKVMEKLQQNVGESEKRSFYNSLREMYIVLNGTHMSDEVRIGIEYKIPITTRRIDFIISGSDGSRDNLVIVELKQWDKVTKTDTPNVVLLGTQEHTHPSWQAYSYAATIEHFNEAIQKEKIFLEPLAFLHNYKAEYIDELTDDIYKESIKLAPVFISSDYSKLRTFLEKYIKVPSKKDLLYEIENGKIKPTKLLVDVMGSMLNNNEEFILLDEQKVIFETLYQIVTKNQKDSQKHVVVVEGGAGTGKSVIAIDLLANLITKKALNTFYVAKSSYVKENYFRKLTRNIPQYQYLRTLFKGSGNFIDAVSNQFNCLIVDEAHRLTEKTKISWFYKGENQVKEIINAAKVTIFFLDPRQSIDIKDFGTIDEISKWANYYNAVIHSGPTFKLKNQFRCNGSDEYLSWVDSIVYNEKFEKSDQWIDYDIKVFDNIMELKDAIVQKNSNNKSRIISGDVFPWVSRIDKTAMDINIEDFHEQWNKTKAFATDEKAIGEVGCIHTTQGMEFEYVGLIIGNDFLYRDNKIITDYTKHPSGANEFKRPQKRKIDPSDGELIDQLIRNTYRVLMSRGQKGCYIYCMDKELTKYLKEKIKIDLKK